MVPSLRMYTVVNIKSIHVPLLNMLLFFYVESHLVLFFLFFLFFNYLV